MKENDKIKVKMASQIRLRGMLGNSIPTTDMRASARILTDKGNRKPNQ